MAAYLKDDYRQIPVNLLDTHKVLMRVQSLCDTENETLEPCVSPQKGMSESNRITVLFSDLHIKWSKQGSHLSQ